MTAADEAVPPVVCTLTLGKRAEQELEWADLAPLALTHEVLSSGVASTYPLTLAGQIEDLASREMSCCGSWLTIKHERADDVFRLQITTENPDGVHLIKSFSGLVDP